MRELFSLVFLLAAPPDAPLFQGPPAQQAPVQQAPAQVTPVQRGPTQGPAAPNIVAPLTFAADLEKHRDQTVVLTGIYRDPGKGGPHILFDDVRLDIADDSFRVRRPDGTLQSTLNDGDCIRCRAHLAYFPGSQEPYEQAISRQSRGGRVVIADGVKLMIHAPQYSLRDAQLLARRPATQQAAPQAGLPQ